MAGLLLLVLLLDFCFPFEVKPQYSTLVLDADGKLLHAFLNPQDKWRMPTEAQDITPALEKAILFKEDRWFRYHFGINPLAVARAFFRNIIKGKRTSGASTITMQVVRLLHPAKRTYGHKLLEMWRAIQLELHYSKDEILQMYVSLVPYSSNIEGLKSASYLFFQKSPEVLSLAEIVTLTIIPNRPSSLRLGVNNALIVQERNRWLKQYEEAGVFSSEEIADALLEPLDVSRHAAPKLAPHLSIRLHKTHPEQAILHTHIKRNKQLYAEQLVKNYVQRLETMHIRNAAVLVINNQTQAIEAYIGSADFNKTNDGGQVDGIQAIRSPGSTLKPLLYGLAFDEGIYTPKSQLYDVPTNFNGFEPENFDKIFHGKVSVEFALANSLNIPAVRVLQRISTPLMVEKLKKAEFQSIKKNASKLGLSLALGGCGVTLEELTNLFASYAHGGNFVKASFLAKESPATPQALLSEEATFFVNTILSQVTRPDLPNNYEYTYRMPKIAWKTGTSFGKKDAWSIGYNAHYTVGVWVGNFSGEGVPELSGANIATPLLFDIFNTIDYNSSAKWFVPSSKIGLRKICAESGDLPNTFCTHQLIDYYIEGISHTRTCTHLQNIWVNASASMRYCGACVPDSGAVQRPYPSYAPELVSWFEYKHIHYERMPPHNPACMEISHQNAPVIVYPTDGAEYILNPKEATQLMLSCQTNNATKTVYWYINDKLYQKASPTANIFFEPPAGRVKISCADDQGNNANSWITVKKE